MSYNATNPVTVGATAKKSQWDRLWDNVVALKTALTTFSAIRLEHTGAPTPTAGEGILYADSATGRVLLSENGGAFTGIGVPPGSIVEFAGPSTPAGWLLCDGAAVSRVTYSALFAAIGGYFGVGDGSTTFNVPDHRGRVAIGAGTGSGLTARALAGQYGVESVSISIAEMPVHNHTATDSGHTHPITDVQHSHPFAIVGGSGSTAYFVMGGFTDPSFNQFTDGDPNTDTSFGYSYTGITGTQAGTANITVGNQGSGAAHTNIQPSLAVNFIIKY